MLGSVITVHDDNSDLICVYRHNKSNIIVYNLDKIHKYKVYIWLERIVLVSNLNTT